MTETRPTAGERGFFDSNGYLQLDSLLPATLVERLLDRLDAAMERRAALDARLADAFDAYRSGDRYAISAHIRIGVGRKAG